MVFLAQPAAIAEDGSFVLPVVPPGEADVVALGEGFVSKTLGQVKNRIDGVPQKAAPDTIIPQAFPLEGPVTQIRLQTEPTATLEFKAVTKTGQPIEGAMVALYPSVWRMAGPVGWWTPPAKSRISLRLTWLDQRFLARRMPMGA